MASNTTDATNTLPYLDHFSPKLSTLTLLKSSFKCTLGINIFKTQYAQNITLIHDPSPVANVYSTLLSFFALFPSYS